MREIVRITVINGNKLGDYASFENRIRYSKEYRCSENFGKLSGKEPWWGNII